MTLPAGFVPLQGQWAEGYKRDIHREHLQPGSLYFCRDMIPNWGQYALKMREGWNMACSVAATGTGVDGGIHARFNAGAKDLFVEQGGNNVLWEFTGGGTPVSRGNVDEALFQNPVFYRDWVIIPRAGNADPMKYIGTGSVTALLGTPPNGLYAATHRSRLLLANDGTALGRVWVSGVDPTTGSPSAEVWNTTATGDWFDTPSYVTGLGPMRSQTLIFNETQTFVLRGSTPGRLGDMRLDLLFGDIGCTDARSICNWGDYVIWADMNSIYMSDGGNPIDLTEQCGIKSDYNPLTTDVIAAGVMNDWLILTISTGSSAYKTYMIDLNKKSAFQLDNFRFKCYWSAPAKLYSGTPAVPQAVLASDIFRIDADDGLDADGEIIFPAIETQYFRESPGLHRIRNLYVGYGFRRNTGDSASVQIDVRYGITPTSSSLDFATDDLQFVTVSDTDTARSYARKRVPIGKAAEGIYISVAVNGRCRDFGLSTLELEGWDETKFRV